MAATPTVSGPDTDNNDSVESLFAADDVYVHPSKDPASFIGGRFELLKERDTGVLSVAWTPYSMYKRPEGEVNSDDDEYEKPTDADVVVAQAAATGTLKKDNNSDKKEKGERGTDLYSLCVPLESVSTISVHSPRWSGYNHLIITVVNGVSFPPFFFHEGGIKQFLFHLNCNAVVTQSEENPNMYAIGIDKKNKLHRTLSGLDMLDGDAVVHEGGGVGGNGEQEDDSYLYKVIDGVTWGVFEGFARIGHYARTSTEAVLANNAARPDLPHNQNNVFKRRPAKADSSFELLGDRPAAATDVGMFELIDDEDEAPGVPAKPHREGPLTFDEWVAFVDDSGRVEEEATLRRRMFYGGIEHELRSEVYKFLLGVYDWRSTAAEREQREAELRVEYISIKTQWLSINPSQEQKFSKFRERRHRIEKDVVRTDRTLPFYEGEDNPNLETLHNILMTYAFYNFDLGYVQGMSDLLAPILYTIQDEAIAFWTFVGLMNRLEKNFHKDQSGMHKQLGQLKTLIATLDPVMYAYFEDNDCLNLFFCFRWLLIQFKREFAFDDVLRLWDVLWSDHLTPHFHIYLCVGILSMHRDTFIEEEFEFDDILKYVNDLSMELDLDECLLAGEAMYIKHAGLLKASVNTPTAEEVDLVNKCEGVAAPASSDSSDE